jgi:hypothetical protein
MGAAIIGALLGGLAAEIPCLGTLNWQRRQQYDGSHYRSGREARPRILHD